MKLSNNTILITGGASGIGLGLAQRFFKENNKVIICGRRKDALEEVKHKFPGIHIIQCDLNNENERIDLFELVKKKYPEMNVLVNNAGIQNWMDINDESFFEKAKAEIQININAPIHLTSLFIKHKPLQAIMNVTSGLSFAPLTKVPVYSATKAFFHSYTVSLRHLLKDKNIEVIEIIPPALNTDLGGKGLHDFAPPVSEFVESIFEQLKNGRNELTFGFTENISNGVGQVLKPVFERMNPS